MKFLFHTHLGLEFPQRISDFAAGYPGHEFVVARDKEELFREIGDVDGLVDHRVNEDLLDRAEKLRWFFVPFTGANRLPWDLLDSRDIRISNNHGNAPIVAERAVALALDVMGRVAEFDRGLRRAYWQRNTGKDEPFVYWTSLTGKRVAILGTGAIGIHIARFIAPFTTDIVGFRRSEAAPVPPEFPSITFNLKVALGHADLCFVALPLTPSTRDLIGEAELAALEDGYLVNVSRGEIVQERPFYDSLKNRLLRGAASDAWYRYPEPFAAPCFPSDLPFHELDNLVLSPHAGSHTTEGKMGQLEGVLENIAACIETGSPRDIVDPKAGY